MRIVHRSAMELPAARRWVFASCWVGPVIALAKIEMMVDMPVEVLRPVIPGSSTDEDSAAKPLRTIETVWSAIVRRNFVISVRTNGRRPNLYRNLRRRVMRGSHKKARRNSR